MAMVVSSAPPHVVNCMDLAPETGYEIFVSATNGAGESSNSSLSITTPCNSSDLQLFIGNTFTITVANRNCTVRYTVYNISTCIYAKGLYEHIDGMLYYMKVVTENFHQTKNFSQPEIFGRIIFSRCSKGHHIFTVINDMHSC